MSGRFQDWTELFARVEGRKKHGVEITMYTLVQLNLCYPLA